MPHFLFPFYLFGAGGIEVMFALRQNNLTFLISMAHLQAGSLIPCHLCQPGPNTLQRCGTGALSEL